MADASTTTTSTTGSGSNSLSLSLPTDFLTGAGNNGLNLNFNFGGNASTIADSAYSFLNTSFGNTQQFLGQSVSGTQQFLQNQVAPIVGVAANLGATFNNLMPGMIGGLYQASINANTVSEQISANATAASEAASQASIAESKKASGGGGLCFITTAVCGTLNLPDDCRELMTLRAFRDGYMHATPEREALVKLYYAVAPRYVERINQRPDSERVYARMYSLFILPAMHALEANDAPEAFALYCALVEYARAVSHEH